VADARVLIGAVVLAGCGGRAAGGAAGPVGNTKLLVAPDRDACVSAVGEGDWGAVDIAVPDPTRAVAACLLQRVADGERTVALVVIVRRGDVWRPQPPLEQTMRETDAEEGEESQSGESSIELFAISPRESAVRWEWVQRSSAPEWGLAETHVELVRISPEGEATEVFSMESTSESGEADNLEDRTLSAARTMTGGLYDLDVEVVHRTAEWAAGDQDYTEESATEHFAWDGETYVQRGSSAAP
jgi:hypothetical protein